MSKILGLRMAAVTLATLLALTIAPSAVVQAQGQDTGQRQRLPEAPEVEAQGWALADAESGQYLDGQNADKRLPTASTTKIMVALIVLEEVSNLEEEVVISREAESFVGSNYSNVGLIHNERVTVEDLLTATLISSANDAAYALAEHLGDGNIEQFVGQMNEKVDELDLENTSFENPAGLNEANHYSSARDTMKITSEALKYERFRELVSQRQATITARGLTEREIQTVNTNGLLLSRPMLSYPQVSGVKAGVSTEGFSLVSSAESESESYIAVVLNAPSAEERFSASEELLHYGFDTFERRALVEEGEVCGEYMTSDGAIELLAAEDLHGTVVEGANIQSRFSSRELSGSAKEAGSANTQYRPSYRDSAKKDEIELIMDDNLPDSADEDEEVSEVEVLVGGKSIGTTPLLAAEDYDEHSLWSRAWHGIGSFFQ